MSTKPIDYVALAKTHGAIESAPESEMPDYSEVPAFLKQNIDMGRVRQVVTTPQTKEDLNSTAGVGDDDPYRVKVYAPDLYGPPILNHELTHTFQDTRNKSLPSISAPITGTGRSVYDYGGVKGLEVARLQGKTIADFNAEQQADMVKDYKWFHDQYLNKAAQGKITPEDEKKMYELQQAYHPFIKQLAAMPGANVNLDRSPLLELLGIQKPVSIGGAPEPPGLPSYDTPGLGVLPADPLMGGRSQATPAPLTLAQVKEHAKKLTATNNQPLPPQPKEALNQYPSPEDQPPDVSFKFNKQWAKPGPYLTVLKPEMEAKFQKWIQENPGVVDKNQLDDPKAGYDIRGWWLSGETGDPAGKRVKNAWDGKMHSSDKFKTPYDGSFSNESMYAMPNAPRWVGDKLMTFDGKLVTDETPRKSPTTGVK
jgi:hypothetical protein